MRIRASKWASVRAPPTASPASRAADGLWEDPKFSRSAVCVLLAVHGLISCCTQHGRVRLGQRMHYIMCYIIGCIFYVECETEMLFGKMCASGETKVKAYVQAGDVR